MILITFSKAGKDDIILTENDLFSFEYQDSCFSGDTFELGGSNARKFQTTTTGGSAAERSRTAGRSWS